MPNNKKNYDLEQVTLDLDDGTQMLCDVLAVFPVKYKGKENNYIALIDTNTPEDAEDGEIFLYRADIEDLDDIKLIDIEDDEEFEVVEDAWDELLDEEEFNEMTGFDFDDEDDDK